MRNGLKTLPFIITIVIFFLYTSLLYSNDLVNHLQEISVTVKAGGSEGSGVIVTRELLVKKDGDVKKKVNFVWTAGHVVDGLRSVRTVIDSKGVEKKIIEFKEAQIVKELTEEGRKVGELKMDAVVIKYSDADNGNDLALLMIRKQDFVQASVDFYLSKDPVPIGTALFHVGSLLGQSGANSMTSGIMSQIGRVLDLGKGTGKVFDQSTVTAFPGSSGGGVFFADGENKGKYIGMLVRGAGEGFNLIVPVRRMQAWCEEVDVRWAIDTNIAPPTLQDLEKIKVEDAAKEVNLDALSAPKDGEPKPSKAEVEFPTLIRYETMNTIFIKK